MIDVTEARMPGVKFLMTRSGIISIPGDMFGAINLIIFCTLLTSTSSKKKLFRDRIFPRDKHEIVFFTPELLGQGADGQPRCRYKSDVCHTF